MLSPDVKELLETLNRLEIPDMADLSPQEARQIFAELKMASAAMAPVGSVENQTIDGPGGPLDLRIFRPEIDEPLPVLVWYHGGGWVLGDLDSAELPARHFCRQTNCAVVVVDYRLAPETPFPGAFDDCLAALRWVLDVGDEYGFDRTRVAVGGDSAGANLAACVARTATDEGIGLCYQVLAYPVVEADFDTDSYEQNGEGYVLTKASMMSFWDHYCPDVADREDPRVRPLSSPLEGLPAAWVYTAQYDPLRDEGQALANALAEAGVEVTRFHHDGAVHSVFTLDIPTGNEARQLAGDALRTAFLPS